MLGKYITDNTRLILTLYYMSVNYISMNLQKKKYTRRDSVVGNIE